MLTGEQLYIVANLYNTGVALGFAQTFAANSAWKDMDIAYGQAREFWPGGPVAGGSRGADLTKDRKPLPTFPWNPAPEPRTFPGTFEFMRDNERTIISILISRTSFAHYASLGGLAAIFEANAHFATLHKFDKNMTPWRIAIQTLDSLISLGNDICRPGENDWRTPLNVQALRELRTEMGTFQGPHEHITNHVKNVGEYVLGKARKFRIDLGNTIAKHAESGVPGQGCHWPKR